MTRERVLWISGGLLAAAAMVALSIRAARLSEQDEERAITHCRALGGEPVLTYSVNSNAFYLTGCKLK